MSATIPKTSITLLKALASEAPNVRWTEFVSRYEDTMRSYVMRHYPSVDVDDVLQNAFISLTKALPGYRYMPDEKGHFRNYLFGVLSHKAMDAIRRRTTEKKNLLRYASEQTGQPRRPSEDEEWQNSLMHVALDQLMADDSIASRNREVFRHVALLGESPERVAADFGITRGNVDVIKNRVLSRLKDLVASMRDNG